MSTFLQGFLAGSVTSVLSIFLFQNIPYFGSSFDIWKGVKKDSPQPNLDILKYGMPKQGHLVLESSTHVLAYDQAKKTPVWVAERINKNVTEGPAHRKHSNFKQDQRIPVQFRSGNADYVNSGWSRGHMSPAGDNKHSQQSMNETFLLSNIVPQDINNNGGFWNRLEIYCRNLTERFSHVLIITGPLMLPNGETEDKRHPTVTYQLIGQNNVAVPTHLYKYIVVEDENNNPFALGAFVVPNQNIGFNHQLKEFQVDPGMLEKQAGVELTPLLNRSSLKDLCKVDSCNLMNQTEMEAFVIKRRIASASNKDQLDKIEREIKEKNIVLNSDKYVKLLEKKHLEYAVKSNEKEENPKKRAVG